MVVKGIIREDTKLKTRYMVEIPVFNSANDSSPAVLECGVSYEPGNFEGYNEGDVVIVAFENNSLSHPFIIGKLYIGPESTATSHSLVDTLKVASKAELPSDTTIEGYNLQELLDSHKKINEVIKHFDNTLDVEHKWMHSIYLWSDGAQTHESNIESCKLSIIVILNTPDKITTSTALVASILTMLPDSSSTLAASGSCKLEGEDESPCVCVFRDGNTVGLSLFNNMYAFALDDLNPDWTVINDTVTQIC